MSKEYKKCVDCRFYKEAVENMGGHAVCGFIDLVGDGRLYYNKQCWIERSFRFLDDPFGTHCGMKARLFQPKNDYEQLIALDQKTIQDAYNKGML